MTETPSLPDKIRVGYRTYEIQSWHPGAASGAGRYGEAGHTERVLRIDMSHGPIQTAETLMHEIIHAIDASCFNQRLHEAKDSETAETVTAGLSSAFTQIMRDSPSLGAWFAWAWAQEDSAPRDSG